MSKHIFFLLISMFAGSAVMAESTNKVVDSGSGIKSRYNGFISQGVAVSENNNFMGDSQSVSFDITEFGINGAWEFNQRWRAASQILYRSIGQVDAPKLNLDYGFFDYRVQSKASYYWGIRLGRVKNPYGFYNETRDVAFTRPSALLSQTLYQDSLRDFTLSSDGINFYSEFFSEIGSFRVDMNVGRSSFTDATRDFAFIGRTKGELKSRGTLIARLLYESDDGRFSAAYSRAHGKTHYDAAVGDMDRVTLPVVGTVDVPIADGEYELDADVFSLRYNQRAWELTGELALVDQKNDDFGLSTGRRSSTSELDYLQGRYHLNSQLTVVARWERVYANTDDKKGDNLILRGRASHGGFHKNNVLGLVWQPSARWMFAIEAQDIEGTYTLTDYAAINDFSAERDWKFYVGILSYRL